MADNRNEKQISSGAKDIKQIRENYEQLNGYKLENTNEIDMMTYLAYLIPRTDHFQHPKLLFNKIVFRNNHVIKQIIIVARKETVKISFTELCMLVNTHRHIPKKKKVSIKYYRKKG